MSPRRKRQNAKTAFLVLAMTGGCAALSCHPEIGRAAAFKPIGGGISPAQMAAIQKDIQAQEDAQAASPKQSGLHRPHPAMMAATRQDIAPSPAAPPKADAKAGHPESGGKGVARAALDALPPNASGNPADPVMTQLHDADGQPYYYDKNHEFHPGTVPPPDTGNGGGIGGGAMAGGATLGDGGQTSVSYQNGNGGQIGNAAPVDDGDDADDDVDQQAQPANGQARGDTLDPTSGMISPQPNGQQAQPQRRRHVQRNAMGEPMQRYYGDNSHEDVTAEMTEALNEMLPNPNQVLAVRRRRADVAMANVAPLQSLHPVIRNLNMTLAAGEMPPVLHLSGGVGTSLTFSDITGKPWYVQRVETDSSEFAVAQSKGDGQGQETATKSNIVTIHPLKQFSQGRNLTVFLDHMPLPVIFQIESGYNKNVDYRVDVSLRHRGPLSRDAVIETDTMTPKDSVFQKFVDGTPPDEAKKLKTSNPNIEAWRIGRKMYVRSTVPVVGMGRHSSSGSNILGVRVYELGFTSEITISDNGQLRAVRIGD